MRALINELEMAQQVFGVMLNQEEKEFWVLHPSINIKTKIYLFVFRPKKCRFDQLLMLENRTLKGFLTFKP